VWARVVALTDAQRTALASALEDINCSKGSATRQVQEYILLELLGKGAFGSVYKARHAVTSQLVALKELPIKEVRLTLAFFRLCK
jgi:NIMA (never in mitosis gene a)-related kinase